MTATDALFNAHLDTVRGRTGRLFRWLLAAQGLWGAVAMISSPNGSVSGAPARVFVTVLVGAALTLPAVLLTWARPASPVSRHVVAISHIGWWALIVHLRGEPIDMHFDVFVSLALLAFYLDWRVLVTATLAIVSEQSWSISGQASSLCLEGSVLLIGIHWALTDMRLATAVQASLEARAQAIESNVRERSAQLEASREQYDGLIETTRARPWRFDRVAQRFSFIGAHAQTVFGHSVEAWQQPGFLVEHGHADDRATLERFAAKGGDVEFRLRGATGAWFWVRCVVGVARPGDQGVLTGLLIDVSEQRQLQFDLSQAQKLESVGLLAAGIAHEINTPVQFVNDSIHFVSDAFRGLLPLLSANKAVFEAASVGPVAADLLEAVTQAEEAADLTYLVENVPKALDRSVEGLGRVATLVRSMKEFGHPASRAKAPADINRAITTTLIIAKNEYKYVADVETSLQPLPAICCHIGELNQAFLNVIVNAAHAIADRVEGTSARGVIRIETALVDHFVEIRISDTGGGIPEQIRERIFEPFFTTKAVGRGTGQGLPIVRSVVVEKHDGTVVFEVDPGVGTTFILRLPTQLEPTSVSEAA